MFEDDDTWHYETRPSNGIVVGRHTLAFAHVVLTEVLKDDRLGVWMSRSYLELDEEQAFEFQKQYHAWLGVPSQEHEAIP